MNTMDAMDTMDTMDMYDTKIMEEPIAVHPVPMMKILYNTCTGGFRFSEGFLQEYYRRTGEEAPRLGGPHSVHPIRTHPVAIQIVEEYGLRWCSGRNSRLALDTIPAVFADYWEIEEYHGDEIIKVNIHRALADILDQFMISGNYTKLCNDYDKIKHAESIYNTMQQPASVGYTLPY